MDRWQNNNNNTLSRHNNVLFEIWSNFIVRNVPDWWLRISFWADIFGTCAWIVLQRFSDFRKNYFFFQRCNFLLLHTDLKAPFEFFFVMTYVVIFVESYYISEWLKGQILILCWVFAYHMIYQFFDPLKSLKRVS